jgi:hypothetical protein
MHILTNASEYVLALARDEMQWFPPPGGLWLLHNFSHLNFVPSLFVSLNTEYLNTQELY